MMKDRSMLKSGTAMHEGWNCNISFKASWRNSIKSIMVVAGTRPEVIKLAPVIKWLQRLKR